MNKTFRRPVWSTISAILAGQMFYTAPLARQPKREKKKFSPKPNRRNSHYQPHQSAREKTRRVGQMEKGFIKLAN